MVPDEPHDGVPSLQEQIQGYLRAVTARGRDTQRIGPFLATFSRHSRNRFLNYAIPDEGARPTATDVAELIRAYEEHGRVPRLEYIATLAPAVEAELESAGFVGEGRLALMVCPPGSERVVPPPAGIELVRPETDQDLLHVRTVQHEAYGEPEPAGPREVDSLRANLSAGGMAVLARVVGNGEPVGAGEYTPVLDGVTELTSVGVSAPFRRRGIAAAITAWLVRDALDAGARVPFLMANEAEERIYSRVGFRTVGRVLHISRETLRG